MSVKYVHTNIIAKDWQKLADFYRMVFDCEPVPPKRNLSGEWLAKATGVEKASLQGVHLRLPGYGDNGPTLEIYQYDRDKEKPPMAADRRGFGHIAFLVDDVHKMHEKVIANGGIKLGDVAGQEVKGVGLLTFVYVGDPEGNILELQRWD